MVSPRMCRDEGLGVGESEGEEEGGEGAEVHAGGTVKSVGQLEVDGA